MERSLRLARRRGYRRLERSRGWCSLTGNLRGGKGGWGRRKSSHCFGGGWGESRLWGSGKSGGWGWLLSHWHPTASGCEDYQHCKQGKEPYHFHYRTFLKVILVNCPALLQSSNLITTVSERSRTPGGGAFVSPIRTLGVLSATRRMRNSMGLGGW